MLDAGAKIYRSEGFSGLYRGFWVSSMQIFSGVAYIGTYEASRHLLTVHASPSPTLKSLLSGGAASLVGQTIIVPFDIISQHLMFLGLVKGNQSDKV